MVAARHLHGRLERDPFAGLGRGRSALLLARGRAMTGWRPGDARPDRGVDAARRPGRRIWRDPHLRRPAGRARPGPAGGPRRSPAWRGRSSGTCDRFDALMAERGVRPTALQPLWNVAGFALGAATALMSEKAAMACTDAVETEIDRHYGRQLDELGDERPRACRRHRRVPRRGARASRHRARAWRRRNDRLSVADGRDSRRMQACNRPVEAHLRNLDGGSAACTLERTTKMSKLSLTIGAAAVGLGGAGRARGPGAGPEHQGQRDHRLRHRPLPALDRRRDRGLRPQAGERALPDPRSAPPGRLAAVAPGLGGRAPSSSRRSAAPASTAARRSGPAAGPAAPSR